MARKPYHKSKHGKAAPVVLPETPDARKAKHLPMFGPDLVISIPLHLWPAYAELYHLGTFRRSMRAGVDLLVKRKESHGK